MVVIDASAAVAHVLPTQATATASRFFEECDERLIAPSIFEFEVRNVLLREVRRGRMSAAEFSAVIAALTTAVETPGGADFDRLDVVADTALVRQLSLFDAAYLQLALDEGAALASRDQTLLDTAASLGVAVHDLR